MPGHAFAIPAGTPAITRDLRRAGGVYYTPAEIVHELVSRTIGDLQPKADGPPRILDPACGAGAMLVGAKRRGVELYGVDCDRPAVNAARRECGAEVWCADALFDRRLDALAPFDAVVANPPYVNIRQLANSRSRAYIERLRARFRTARGNFDLYVVFFERALELLGTGGRCGMIVPNKWATLDYARPLRKMLLTETTIEHV
ncbi:MAG TPA: N-6 DNA methylase, partial [Pirellulaceae bacterium]|nr:N-6 DNA methylase [Pirellulaceae bacterium]